MTDVTTGDALVIGTAILHDGRVLAARRTHPEEAAGRWELPGGKVEPGEQAAETVAREIAEELECEVRVVGMLDGEVPIGPGYVLRIAVAELVSGEPVPHEHDAVRWLAADQLEEVAWMAADRPFVPGLRALLGEA